MRLLSLIFCLFLFLVTTWAAAPVDTLQAKTDSVPMRQCPVVRKSWFVVPIAFYQEETSVGLGLSGGYYFKSNNLSKISSISGSVVYTFKNQAKININTRNYFANNKVYLAGNVNLRHYPESYYGIGNAHPLENPIQYTTQAFQIAAQPYYSVTDRFLVGINASVRGERLVKYTENLYQAGWDDYLMFGLGAQVMYDGRDNTFYPQKLSHFVKLQATTYNKKMGSSFDLTSVTFDFRQYIPTVLGQVFAYQLYMDMRIGKDVPFQMLPTVGGSDNIRGFRERMYTDNMLFEAQFEYRMPIYKRLKAVVFCSVGDVIDVYNPHIEKIKIGYGAGLRLRLNDARVNLRLDVAGNNFGEVKFYITATEAF